MAKSMLAITAFIKSKAAHAEQLERAFIAQQKEIARKQATIDRFKASATKAKMAQSMMKSLEKIELITPERSSTSIRFTFPEPIQSGKTVLTVHQVTHTFGAKKIFENINFTLERGEKVGLVAANGQGKTTLFNLITKLYALQKGTVTLGYNVQPSVFNQDQNQVLSPEHTIIETVEPSAPTKTQQYIRNFLGSFLFTKDDIHKKIGVLSGGEKNRVSMVKVLLSDANFLLLDEPTNHLDIPSKEILLSALQSYKGTILFVSHDHDFINKLATRIIELTPTGACSYTGNYDAYLYQKIALEETVNTNKSSSTPSKNPASLSQENLKKELFELKKNCKRLEEKITRIERETTKLQQQLEPLTYGTPEFMSIYNHLGQLNKDHALCLNEWEQLQYTIMEKEATDISKR
jgi:ATP-binding cassette subfamily F protein 3